VSFVYGFTCSIDLSTHTHTHTHSDMFKEEKKMELLHVPSSPCPRAPSCVALRLFRNATMPSLIEKDVERIFVSEDSEPPDSPLLRKVVKGNKTDVITTPPLIDHHVGILNRFRSHLLRRPKIGNKSLERRGVSLNWLIETFLNTADRKELLSLDMNAAVTTNIDTSFFVQNIICPLTKEFKTSLWDLIPEKYCSSPETFVSYAWTSSLDNIAQAICTSKHIRYIWIDFVCVCQHSGTLTSLSLFVYVCVYVVHTSRYIIFRYREKQTRS